MAAGCSGDLQFRADIADRLRLLLFTRAMQDADGGLRLDRVAGGVSASGWATQLCRAALPSAAGDARLRQRERPHPTVGGSELDGTGMHRTITEVAELVATAAVGIAGVQVPGEHAADNGLSVVAGMRSGSRRHRGAAHLQHSIGVPAAARPADPEAQERVVVALDRDPKAARRSVRVELARLQGVAPGPTGADDPLAALWEGYLLDALMTLARRDHRYAHVVAAAAVSPRPAIRADVAAALTAQIRRLESGDPAWEDLATELVAAFLAHISDVPSEFSPAHRTAMPQPSPRRLLKQRLSATFSTGQRRSHRRRWAACRRWWSPSCRTGLP